MRMCIYLTLSLELENEVDKSKDEDEAKSMENVERLIDENSPSI